MSYFFTNLSFDLLVKEFLKSVNFWRSYRQNGWLCHKPHTLRRITRQISKITWVWRTETVANCCCVNRQINVNKYQTAVDQFWLTDWQTYAISDWPTADHVRHFAATSFQQLCAISHGIFIWCGHHFVCELNNEYFIRQIFSNSFWVAKFYMAVCFKYFLSMAIFWTQIFHQVV